MPKRVKPLNPREVERAKPGRHADGDGLYLVVGDGAKPSDRKKTWLYRYTKPGTSGKGAGVYTIGKFPAIGLSDARTLRDEAASLVARGINPAQHRKQARQDAKSGAGGNSIAGWFDRYVDHKRSDWSEAHCTKFRQSVRKNVLAYVGDIAIDELTPQTLAEVLSKVKNASTAETAFRARIHLAQIIDYAVELGVVSGNVAKSLAKTFPKPKSGRQRALTNPAEIGQLLAAIHADEHSWPNVRYAMRLFPLLLLRHAEMLSARWSDVDFEAAVMTIPPERLKGKKDRKKHGQPLKIPLSTQAVEILKQLHEYTGGGDLLFPSPHARNKPMTQPPIRDALEELGWRGRHSIHGWRATASTILNESGKFHPDAIERQLDHGDPDRVRAAYARGDYWDERVNMMQWLADNYDALSNAAVSDGLSSEK